MRFMRYVKIGALALVLLLLLSGAAFLIVSDRMGQPSPPDPASLIAKRSAVPRAHRARPLRRAAHHRRARRGCGFRHGVRAFRRRFCDYPAGGDGGARAVRGERRAEEAAVTDYLVRLFRVWETVNAKYDSDLPADLRKVLEAYADGVNYYAELHPDQVMRGLAAVYR